MEKIRGHFECQDCKAIVSSDTIPTKCLCGANNFVVVGLNNQVETKAQSLSMDECRLILADTYELIIKLLDEYSDITEDTKKIIAIWSIGTHFHESFQAYPYLILNAMRGSGKSRLLRILSFIGNGGDGSVTNNITEASIFRQPRNKILCIDEVENINSKDKMNLRTLLNAAYKKGAFIIRMKKVKNNVEEKHIAENFYPYFPIAMASIKAVEEVLSDRSITVIIEKSFNEGIVKKIEDFDTNEDILKVKTSLKKVTMTMSDVVLGKKDIYKKWNKYISDKYNNVTQRHNVITSHNVAQCHDIELEELFIKIDQANILGRNLELIMPLLFVAKAISNELLEEILNIAKTTIAEKREEEYQNSKDIAVYSFVSALEMKVEYIVKNLVNHFRLFIGDDDNDDMWLNERWFGQALKRLNLILAKKRSNNARYVVLDIEKAKEMASKFKEKNNDIFI
jgi:hypothetical protein